MRRQLLDVGDGLVDLVPVVREDAIGRGERAAGVLHDRIDLLGNAGHGLVGALDERANVRAVSDAHVERAADLAIVNLELDISLFKDRGYLGVNFMNYTPVAMAKFNTRSGKLEWNMDYAKNVNDRLTGVLTANGK